MKLLNEGIKHISLGSGRVTEFDGKYLTVVFKTKTCKFAYPSAFEKFLQAGDPVINDAIMKEIEAAKAAAEEAKRKSEEAKKAEEQKKLEELAQKAGKSGVVKAHKKTARVEGQRMVFFVFQGNSFGAEFQGGYIWAPKYTSAGGTCHHWDSLLDVRKGDVILHGVDGIIEAVSVAKGPCYDAESPKALQAEQLWQKAGRRVDCEYTKIRKPIKYSDYKETNKKYSGVKYAPFDKDGNGNMGYLFEMNMEHAKFFIEASIKNNGYLLDLDYVQDLMK